MTSRWTPGFVENHRSEPRSYDVKNIMDPERVFRRNRLDIRPRSVAPSVDQSPTTDPPATEPPVETIPKAPPSPNILSRPKRATRPPSRFS